MKAGCMLLQVKAVDFGKGAKTFEVRAATITKGKIEIRLDGLDGTLLGVCNINNTGGWNTWKTFTADVEKRVEFMICTLFLEEVMEKCLTWTIGDSSKMTGKLCQK